MVANNESDDNGNIQNNEKNLFRLKKDSFFAAFLRLNWPRFVVVVVVDVGTVARGAQRRQKRLHPAEAVGDDNERKLKRRPNNLTSFTFSLKCSTKQKMT